MYTFQSERIYLAHTIQNQHNPAGLETRSTGDADGVCSLVLWQLRKQSGMSIARWPCSFFCRVPVLVKDLHNQWLDVIALAVAGSHVPHSRFPTSSVRHEIDGVYFDLPYASLPLLLSSYILPALTPPFSVSCGLQIIMMQS